jgi:hypothetical protein
MPIWRFHWIAVTPARGKVPSIVAGLGRSRLMWARIFSITAVALNVLNTLAATTRCPWIFARSSASRRSLR